MTTIAEQVGRVVGGRYRLLAPVGAGASSQVFAASDTRLSRRVAVKVLHPMLATDRVFLRRFSAEARLAASLDHPHVMRVFDWGEEAEGPYLVLEYLGGGSLRALLDQGVLLSHSQAARVGAQAASGLAYAHRRGIVHRDIKPSNLLFDEEGHLRIADFGVARALAESAMTEPMGAIFGTARYASPEQAEGRQLDDRSDVYSLALVLYESLTGRVPFTSDTIASTLMARVGATLPIASELGPLAPIVAQASISEPLARLDAAALCSDLEMLVRDLPRPESLPLARVSLDSRVAVARDRDPTTQVASAAFRTRITDIPETAGSPSPAAEADAGVDVEQSGPVADPFAHGLSEAELAELLEMDFGIEGPTTSPVAPAPAEAGPATTVVAAAPDVSTKVLATAAPKAAKKPVKQKTKRSRSWRRILVWALLIVVLLGGAGVGGSLAYVRLVVYGHVVPKLDGLQLTAAEAAAHKVGLHATETSSLWQNSIPAGVVLKQSIRPGRHEKAGTIVKLTVSLGPKPVPVPPLTHDTASVAEAAIVAGHLKYGTSTSAYSARVPADQVISWTDEGRSVAPNTTINLVISKGHAPVIVPTIPQTDTWSEAYTALKSAGLNPSEDPEPSPSGVPSGDVISMSVTPGATVPWHSAVVVTVSTGLPFTKVPYIPFGTSVSAAESILIGQHLKYWFKDTGYGSQFVVEEVPAPGTSERWGYAVELVIAG
jgi:serine/threonine protein kinase/beta-lactam-binding protein with PASTA domain